ncbi:hypothetical protein DPMN_030925 [Dreissena polymorpha]|uniref:Uncharacterized protein n=1 Tax=Dreissena polymorpha TaxID=45954 RepID=A0A9D4LZX7_DREPO|nr:hypothetical protein DPMN_030925 [Dreissena polymorpha]
MLRIILNRLKSKADELLVEEQTGFKDGRNTVEQLDIKHSTSFAIFDKPKGRF